MKCGAENPEGVKFCGECGSSLSADIICPQCGYKNPKGIKFCHECGCSLAEQPQAKSSQAPSSIPTSAGPSLLPTAFANSRYQVKKFLGEGGKKKVYLAHDTVLDRDVAFYLIKTEKLDESARTRIKREAQAMGRLGEHPNIMSIFDFGDHEGQPYMVAPLMSGGDVEGLIKKAPDHKLALDKALEITKSVCKGLEFAHAKGVIHRDIKPGNIWMSADGTVKIGDFGLAVAVDLSRLTQTGMMVGTVSYMPPEQAMGGNVTDKADLYSLGTMLYEMVTGRPPFIGDDSVAIIGQHINTPPVSPTWHRADLPPALETLIMQLLEKDPEKRPASATLVLQALESIEKGKTKGEPAKETVTPAENPLYRRHFVGRENELKQLQSAFDSAISGHGSLMMVLGEPGIGKTALCEQLATYVTLRGGRTLVGHCYEEGSLSLPYLAFVEAMRSYVLDREADDLKKDLGSGATDVARIVSEIREKLDIKPRTTENPEEDRYRLMQAVTSFLTHASAVKPMLVVLEDLHDADKGTLEMLTYISRNLSGARLLVVGTYRDVEVDRTHPLSAALAELRRVSTFGRVVLRGLNADEVRRMLESITQESVPWGLAEAVHRQTEGNPLFVQEVIRYLTEQKLLIRAGGRLLATGDTPIEMNIPEGLRDVIGKRLSHLSQACNRLLSIAAVIGREFALEAIKAVAGIDEASFVSTLKEAVQLAVLEERLQMGSVRYRFTHAFFRQTLYEEMIAPERLKLHQQVARALEALYSKRLEEHAAEMAEHFSQSTDSSDLKKAVEYGAMAAKRAVDVYAYSEAVRLLDAAVRVQRVLDPDDKAKQCDLLLDLCDALLSVPDTKRIIEAEALAAYALAEATGNNRAAVRACKFALDAIVYEQVTIGIASPLFTQWIERADRYALPETPERAIVDSYLGAVKWEKGDMRTGEKLFMQSLSLARRLDDNVSILSTGINLVAYRCAPQHMVERLQLAEELWMRVQRVRGVWLGRAYGVVDIFLASGRRQSFEEVCADMRALSQRTGVFLDEYNSAGMDSLLALIDGRLEEAIKTIELILERAEQAGLPGLAGSSTTLTANRARIYMGVPSVIPDSIARSFHGRVGSCLVSAYLGRKEDVSKILERYVIRRAGMGTKEDYMPAWGDVVFLEAAVITGHSQAAQMLLNRLIGTGVRTSGARFPTCAARHLGGAAALLGRYDEARQHYHEAIRVCTEMRFRPELALTRLQFAELLFEHYPEEKKDALEHLDFAIKEFREMKMQPSLERALRHKEILKA
jgi:serine/threonine protein kinase/tetratricopeptide (TPR) repeat protein